MYGVVRGAIKTGGGASDRLNFAADINPAVPWTRHDTRRWKDRRNAQSNRGFVSQPRGCRMSRGRALHTHEHPHDDIQLTIGTIDLCSLPLASFLFVIVAPIWGHWHARQPHTRPPSFLPPYAHELSQWHYNWVHRENP